MTFGESPIYFKPKSVIRPHIVLSTLYIHTFIRLLFSVVVFSLVFSWHIPLCQEKTNKNQLNIKQKSRLNPNAIWVKISFVGVIMLNLNNITISNQIRLKCNNLKKCAPEIMHFMINCY